MTEAPRRKATKKVPAADGETILQRIEVFNAGRDPERLAMKYERMRLSPFVFYRGTCHLFYEDLPRKEALFRSAPLAWICGDLHLENFGSYKGDNRLAYFDINDFDEGCLAPTTWELSRLVCSIFVAADTLSLKHTQALKLAYTCLESYADALADGHVRWIERDTARGMVFDLLEAIRLRKRFDLINERTEIRGRKRRLKIDGRKALPATDKQRERAERVLAAAVAKESNQSFYRVIDVARRIAGTGSLGLERYVVLVEGKGGIKGNYLLDLKVQPGSSLAPWLTTPQPPHGHEAERVLQVQRRAQAISQAMLHAVQRGRRSFLVKEMSPTEDRVELADWNGRIARLESVLQDMGRLAAWSHLRGAARQGSASPDELIAWAGQRSHWLPELVSFADSYAQQVVRDWAEFLKESAKRS